MSFWVPEVPMTSPACSFVRSGLSFMKVGGAVAVVLLVSGCRSDSGNLPPVFNAVFGLDSAESTPFRTGKISEPAPGPKARVIGDAANNPGQCIFATPRGNRFRAACPEGYAIGSSD